MLEARRAKKHKGVTYGVVLVSDGGDRADGAISNGRWALSDCVNRGRINGRGCVKQSRVRSTSGGRNRS